MDFMCLAMLIRNEGGRDSPGKLQKQPAESQEKRAWCITRILHCHVSSPCYSVAEYYVALHYLQSQTL